MGKNYKRRAIDQIKFSIGAKLIVIISLIVVISLGSITVLVSWLFREDLRISAEENNYEINRRSAAEAESTITNIRSHSRVLMQTVTGAGAGTAMSREAVDFFFNENRQIGALFYIVLGGEERLLVNKSFFSSREIDEELINPYFQAQRNAMGMAIRGETVVLNATPHFSHPCLVLFFPWQNDGVGCVLFSSETLNNNFGYGANQTYMINSSGDILAHSDSSLIKSLTNIANDKYISQIMKSTDKSKQQLINVEQTHGTGETITIRQFSAFTKLNVAGAIVITNIEYYKVFEGINATTRRNIYLTAAVLSLSIILIWFFSKSISFPLKGLARAARQIEGGIFELQLSSKAKDEIGVLTSSFQKMCSALHIFGRFTNKEIAVKAMRNEIKPGGLAKHATIFFSDIREFTAKCENFTKVYKDKASDRIVHWLNNYFTQMIECIEKTNGVVDKFIGDAVMAHWGTAYTAGSARVDAFNCVKAALMMRKALYFMNSKREAGDHSNPSIKIGCGINSGVVTAGQLGSDKRMEYTVIGDPVNLASRIEALTKPLGADILISEDTWKLVGDKFLTEEMPSVTVKGKEKPVRIFAVINFAGQSKGPKTMMDVRELLGFITPRLEDIDVNADEKKYKIGA